LFGHAVAGVWRAELEINDYSQTKRRRATRDGFRRREAIEPRSGELTAQDAIKNVDRLPDWTDEETWLAPTNLLGELANLPPDVPLDKVFLR
jgi:hypothetical protein